MIKKIQIKMYAAFFSFLLSFGLSGFAQQTDTANNRDSKASRNTPPEAEAVVSLKTQALNAIYDEIVRAKDYENMRDRITVWTLAADILWENDPKESRRLLRDAFSKTKDATAVVLKGDKEFAVALKNDKLQRSLRTEILLIAQKRDAKLTKELIDSLDDEDVKELEKLHDSPTRFGSSSLVKSQIAAFAAILAKTDPKKAVEYAIASLGYGVPQEFTDVYKSLLASNSESASQLFSEATNHFLADNSLNLYDGLILSSYLRLAQVSESDQDVAQRLLSGAFLREQRVWQAVQENRFTDPNLAATVLATSQTLFQLFQSHYPERLGEIENFIRVVSLNLSKPPEFADEKISDSNSFNDPDSLLQQAEKERDEAHRNALYLEAALAFARKNIFDRALDAASRATDETKREAVVSFIRRRQAGHLIEQADFYEALKVIEKVVDPEVRAELTAIFVKKARQKKANQLASQLLIDTQRMLEKSFVSISTARAYLWLGSACSAFDPVLGLDLMESAIKRANKTKDFIELNPTSKIVHLGGRSNQAVIVSNSNGDFRDGFKALAKQNFVQSLLLAEGFENKFFRGIAILAGASAVLDEEKKKVRTSKQTPQTIKTGKQ